MHNSSACIACPSGHYRYAAVYSSAFSALGWRWFFTTAFLCEMDDIISLTALYTDALRSVASVEGDVLGRSTLASALSPIVRSLSTVFDGTVSLAPQHARSVLLATSPSRVFSTHVLLEHSPLRLEQPMPVLALLVHQGNLGTCDLDIS